MKMAGQFDFYKVFSSHMVLQRKRPIIFSGTAEAGKNILLTFAGIRVATNVDENGVWHAKFPAMEAGGPYTAKLSGDEITSPITLHDILIGDVWMCAGQSNMEMPLWSETPFWRSSGGNIVAAESNYPYLRLYNSSLIHRMSPEVPLSDVDSDGACWECCSPETVKNFSACGFFFGRKLMTDLNIPIGLISTACGGTDIQAWISREKYEQEGCCEFLQKRDSLIASNSSAKKNMETQFKIWLQNYHAFRKNGQYGSWLQPDYDDSAWDRGANIFFIPSPGEKIFRCTFYLPYEMAGQELTLSLGILNDVDETYLNGIMIGKTDVDVPAYWSKKRVYTIPADAARAGRNVLAIINDNHYSAGGFSPECPVTLAVSEHPEQQIVLSQWCAKTAFYMDLEKFGPRPLSDGGEQNIPCTLFNGMMNPWFQYPVCGIIWYQGCNNIGLRNYYVHLRYLIEDWRLQWHEPELPFILVQLAGLLDHCPDNRRGEELWRHLEPEETPAYAITREIQAEMPKHYSHVGMAVTMDIGDPYDIHPGDKKTLGYRLACEAERMVYSMPKISQGPEFDHFVVENGKVRVFFNHTEGGLCTKDGKALGAFALAGKAGQLYWADAKIEGDTVVVFSSMVPDPVRVRYAYVNYRGDCNLMNGAGFPAVPFRSDKEDYSREMIR